MNASDLLIFVEKQIPTFTNLAIEQAGIAYHYTQFPEEIRRDNKILGAAITPNLHWTQSDSGPSHPARFDPGVVFTYPALRTTAYEGCNFEIIKIWYKAAVSADHFGDRSPYKPYSRTFMILTGDIEDHKFLPGIGRDHMGSN